MGIAFYFEVLHGLNGDGAAPLLKPGEDSDLPAIPLPTMSWSRRGRIHLFAPWAAAFLGQGTSIQLSWCFGMSKRSSTTAFELMVYSISIFGQEQLLGQMLSKSAPLGLARQK